MRNPCHKCLIRASCSKQCNKSLSYGAAAAQFTVTFTCFITLAFLIPLIYYMTTMIPEHETLVRSFIITLWFGSFIISALMKSYHAASDDIPLFVFLLLGPIITIQIAICWVTRPYFKTAAKGS